MKAARILVPAALYAGYRAGYQQNSQSEVQRRIAQARIPAKSLQIEVSSTRDVLDEYFINNPISADFLISSLLASIQEIEEIEDYEQYCLAKNLNGNSKPPGCPGSLDDCAEQIQEAVNALPPMNQMIKLAEKNLLSATCLHLANYAVESNKVTKLKLRPLMQWLLLSENLRLEDVKDPSERVQGLPGTIQIKIVSLSSEIEADFQKELDQVKGNVSPKIVYGFHGFATRSGNSILRNGFVAGEEFKHEIFHDRNYYYPTIFANAAVKPLIWKGSRLSSFQPVLVNKIVNNQDKWDKYNRRFGLASAIPDHWIVTSRKLIRPWRIILNPGNGFDDELKHYTTEKEDARQEYQNLAGFSLHFYKQEDDDLIQVPVEKI